MKRKKRIICYCSPSGSRIYRVEQIAKYVNRLPNYEMVISPNSTNDREMVWADVIFVQGLIDPRQIADLWAYKMERGKKIITDRDDVLEVQGDNPFLKRNKDLSAVSWSKELLRLCDMVTVTTPTIAEEVKQYNTNVHILPNYLDMEVWDQQTTKNESKVLRIGWAGSITHRDDLAMVMPVIKELLAKYPHLKFVFCGDPRVETLLEGVSKHQYQYVQGTPIFLQWPKLAHTLALDIAIAPLVDTHFNRGRSALKYLEYSMLKTPGVYSPAAYEGTIKNGETGYIASDLAEWRIYLETLIDYPDIRERMGKEAYTDVRDNYSIAKHITDWVRLYKAL